MAEKKLTPPGVKRAYELSVAYGTDPDVRRRYPSRAAFVGADMPGWREATVTSLLEGRSVVLVQPTGGDVVIGQSIKLRALRAAYTTGSWLTGHLPEAVRPRPVTLSNLPGLAGDAWPVHGPLTEDVQRDRLPA